MNKNLPSEFLTSLEHSNVFQSLFIERKKVSFGNPSLDLSLLISKNTLRTVLNQRQTGKVRDTNPSSSSFC